jgi:hypothetical protein
MRCIMTLRFKLKEKMTPTPENRLEDLISQAIAAKVERIEQTEEQSDEAFTLFFNAILSLFEKINSMIIIEKNTHTLHYKSSTRNEIDSLLCTQLGITIRELVNALKQEDQLPEDSDPLEATQIPTGQLFASLFSRMLVHVNKEITILQKIKNRNEPWHRKART